MDFDSSMRISASGLSANRAWINVLSANLANMNTTRTQDGKPYQRRTIIYESVPSASSFDEVLDNALQEEVQKVQVTDIVADGRDFKEVYDPSHPDANEEGVVLTPNISQVEEMANLVNASRSYEANLAAINTAKQLALKAIEIGK
ncbi:MAG: flagellar basal body rod protein FlgC [Syntrophobacteraceae bacterium]|jgi:flagellar basal-body rod protein FlgC|nr:flagellar basal body rod protein FlgC [Syntrophobacteraceae bacterium]NTV44039.1 flagellar basal body rod protein FlgC [Syntrophobacteraceae bacterium]